MGEALCTLKGVKNLKPNTFNPIAQIFESREAKRICKPRTAKLFMRLMAEGKVPSWVLREIDIRMLGAAK